MPLEYAEHVLLRAFLGRVVIGSVALSSLCPTKLNELVSSLPNHIVHLVARAGPVVVVISVEKVPRHVSRSEGPARLMQRRLAILAYVRPGPLEGLCDD